jgi:cyanate permease
MTDHDPLRAFEPPRAPTETPPQPSKQPQTTGYLIGAIVQLLVGAFLMYRGATRSQGTLLLLMGIFLVVLGVRAVQRYRRSRRHAVVQYPPTAGS